MEITINIRGLDGLTAAIEKIAMGQISIPQYIAEKQGSIETPQQVIQEIVQAPIQQAPTAQNQGVVPQQSIPQRNTYTQQQTQQQAYQAPAQNNVPQQQVPPNQAPTTAQSYDMNQLAVAATQLIDAGRLAEIQQLLGQFNVQALTALPKEQYGAFATALRGLGAKL